ncbi:MAG TPA: protein-glutamate O-methyltransferase CheR [Planctomycetota bacterium]|nr:protein-glutamate O-methyltransferase CheR [Planctomycetota bacterium]
MKASATDLEQVSRLVAAESGVVLGEEKGYLIRSLLAPLALAHGSSLRGLLDHVEADSTGELKQEIVETLLNHETWFFRDPQVFEALAEHVLPEIAARGRFPIRVWSAGCATGQEPYSVAMAVEERFPRLRDQIEVWASDLSERTLARAQEGRYTQLEVNRGLKASLLVRHFEEDGEHWRVRAGLKERVRFGRLNLAGPWPPLPEMDVILIRNVLMYFGMETRAEVLERVHRLLRPDGHLFLGAAEGTIPAEEAFALARNGRVSWHRARPVEV